MTAALRKIHPDLWKKGESMKRWIHLEAKVDTLRVVHSHPWSKGWWWSTSLYLHVTRIWFCGLLFNNGDANFLWDWSFSFQVGVFLSMAPGQSFPIGISPLRRHFRVWCDNLIVFWLGGVSFLGFSIWRPVPAWWKHQNGCGVNSFFGTTWLLSKRLWDLNLKLKWTEEREEFRENGGWMDGFDRLPCFFLLC